MDAGPLIALLGFALVATALWDGVETLVLPRNVERRLGISTIFYNLAWRLVGGLARKVPSTSIRQHLLAAYSPVSILLLIAVWAALIVLGFAMVYLGTHVAFTSGRSPRFDELVYFSGITFFTVGFGDMAPISGLGRAISVLESATGFGYLAVLIGFVPVLYSSFSRREAHILLLDSKAGSNPTAFEILRRHSEAQAFPELVQLLKDWERVAAELLENFISFPVLAYYRSQHVSQSWLGSMVAIMDTCALLDSSLDDEHPAARALRFQARATFAMGRHLLVDLAYLIDVQPDLSRPRLAEGHAMALRQRLIELGAPLRCCIESESLFAEVRKEYEPFAQALAEDIILDLPGWSPDQGTLDNWQVSAWDRATHF